MGVGDVSFLEYRKVSSEHQMKIPLSEMIIQGQGKELKQSGEGQWRLLFQERLEIERERISGQY